MIVEIIDNFQEYISIIRKSPNINVFYLEKKITFNDDFSVVSLRGRWRPLLYLITENTLVKLPILTIKSCVDIHNPLKKYIYSIQLNTMSILSVQESSTEKAPKFYFQGIQVPTTKLFRRNFTVKSTDIRLKNFENNRKKKDFNIINSYSNMTTIFKKENDSNHKVSPNFFLCDIDKTVKSGLWLTTYLKRNKSSSYKLSEDIITYPRRFPSK